MLKKKLLYFVAIVLCISLPLAGCETFGSSAATGAGGGVLLSLIFGGNSSWENAAIGAVIGALAGVIAHEVKESRQTKTASETEKQHNEWNPEDGLAIKLENTTITPQLARVNDQVTSRVEYAILGAPSNGVDLVRAFELKDEKGKLLLGKSKEEKKVDGTWNSEVGFTVADEVKPGNYTLEQVIATKDGSQMQVAKSFFTVATDHAGNVTIVESSPEMLAAMNH